MSSASRHLWVGGLPEEIDEAGIKEFFNKFGKVEGVKVLPQRYPNIGVAAFIDFHDVKSAIEAKDAKLRIGSCELRTNFKFERQNQMPPKWLESPDKPEKQEKPEKPEKQEKARAHESSSSSSGSDSGSSGSSSSSSSDSDQEVSSTSKKSKKKSSSGGGEVGAFFLKVTGLAHRPERVLQDGLYYEFTRYSPHAMIKMYGELPDKTYAVVKLKKAGEFKDAYKEAQGLSLFGSKIKLTPLDQEDFPPGGRDSPFVPHGAGGPVGPMGRVPPVPQGFPPEEVDPQATRSLFVGNIPKNISVYELRDIFQRFGNILDVEIKKMSGNATYGFVLFYNLMNAITAKQYMDGENIRGNHIRVGFGKGTPTKMLWIDGINPSMSESALERHMIKHGKVVRLGIDRQCCCAMVQYDSMDAAKDALNAVKGTFIGNSRRLMTDYANRDARAVFFSRIETGEAAGPPRGFPSGPGGMYNPPMGPRGGAMMMPRPSMPMMGMGRGGFPPHGHAPPMDYYFNPYMDEGMAYYGGGRPPFHGPGPMGMRRFSHGHGPYEEGYDEYEEELRAFTRKREWEREREKRKERKKKQGSSSESEESDSEDSSSRKKKKSSKEKEKDKDKEKERHKKSKKEKSKEKDKEAERSKSEGETDSEDEEKREEARIKATQKSRDLREKLKKKSKKKREKETKSDEDASSGQESASEAGVEVKKSSKKDKEKEKEKAKSSKKDKDKEEKKEGSRKKRPKSPSPPVVETIKQDKVREVKPDSKESPVESPQEDTPAEVRAEEPSKMSQNGEMHARSPKQQEPLQKHAEKEEMEVEVEPAKTMEVKVTPSSPPPPAKHKLVVKRSKEKMESDLSSGEDFKVSEMDTEKSATKPSALRERGREMSDIREKAEPTVEREEVDKSRKKNSRDHPKDQSREHSPKPRSPESPPSEEERAPTRREQWPRSEGESEDHERMSDNEATKRPKKLPRRYQLEEEERKEKRRESKERHQKRHHPPPTTPSPPPAFVSHRRRHYHSPPPPEYFERRRHWRGRPYSPGPFNHRRYSRSPPGYPPSPPHHRPRSPFSGSPPPRPRTPIQRPGRDRGMPRHRYESPPYDIPRGKYPRRGSPPSPPHQHYSHSPPPRSRSPGRRHLRHRSPSPSPPRLSPVHRRERSRSSESGRSSPRYGGEDRERFEHKRRAKRPGYSRTPSPRSKHRESLKDSHPEPKRRRMEEPRPKSPPATPPPPKPEPKPPKPEKVPSAPHPPPSKPYPPSEAPPTSSRESVPKGQVPAEPKQMLQGQNTQSQKVYYPHGGGQPQPVSQPSHPPPLSAPSSNQQQQQQTDNLLDLLRRYPVMWQGHLMLKNDSAAVQLHFLSGNVSLAKLSLPQSSDQRTPSLRIAQRMRLEQTQLEGVERRIHNEKEHCLLLALPCGRDANDVRAQTHALKNNLISYLLQKQAAGIINVQGPQTGFVLHIFPPCPFSQAHLSRVAPDLLSSASDNCHLMIVVATM